MLAEEFVRAGHEVRVVTQTPGETGRAYPYAVLRNPSLVALFEAVTWSEVCLHNNISLRTAWPLLLVRRPWVIGHQMWISRADGCVARVDRLKLQLLRHATNIACSAAIARPLGVPAEVVGNPYDADVFKRTTSGTARPGDLIFVGRLVSDKGVDVLLDALAVLHARGTTRHLTIVGGGPEELRLREQARRLGLDGQTTFVGAKTPAEIAPLLNRHRILVVPSRRPEPFGIVALEGLACGCVVIGSNQGGLPDAMGSCGLTFPNGDASALAATIDRALRMDSEAAEYRARVAEHLAAHTRRTVAARYLEILKRAILDGRAGESGP
jgi:glycosyltransferase involved in cell wall biosynthesis